MRYLIIDTEKLESGDINRQLVYDTLAREGVLLTEKETHHIFKDIYEAGFCATSPLDFDKYKSNL